LRKLIYLFAVVAIALASLGFLAKSTLFPIEAPVPIEAPALSSRATISIGDLHRSIDMKALPVQEAKDPI
jgi:hypothetical protein